MSKEERFYEILKKYGVKEFWCSHEMDLSLKYPLGVLYVGCSMNCREELEKELWKLFNGNIMNCERNLMIDACVDDFSTYEERYFNYLIDELDNRKVK